MASRDSKASSRKSSKARASAGLVKGGAAGKAAGLKSGKAAELKARQAGEHGAGEHGAGEHGDLAKHGGGEHEGRADAATPALSLPAAHALRRASDAAALAAHRSRARLVMITGLSGSGKITALKVFEDMGYYCVDNLPAELIPSFAQLIQDARDNKNAAIVVDIREGSRLEQLPAIIAGLKKRLDVKLIYLDTSDKVLVRRFSETRRPHPLGSAASVPHSITSERRRLEQIRNIADLEIDTSKFNVHELRTHLVELFKTGGEERQPLLVSTLSFGFKNGVPESADLVFDVRFLPNPHFIPEFRPYTGKHPKVAKYIRSFPQTQEFIAKVMDMLLFLLPHYVAEGKSYLTIGFGCTGGQHRSVFMAEEIRKQLAKAGYRVKVEHRDSPR